MAVTNMVVPIMVMAFITAKSLAKKDSINRLPTPGIPKNRSTI